MGSPPLSLQYQLAYPTLGVDQQLTQPLMLTFKAEDTKITERPPLTLMLCVDLSGSMMGRPLELVVESLKMLLNQLNPNDRLGMVTFANKGRLVSPVRKLDPEGRGFFLGVLSSIQAAGSTNLEEGIRLALKEMPECRDGEIAHVVLLSDGKPNRGETETRLLSKIVAEQRGGVTVSCFGYGLKHDEDMLQVLAKKGGGGYAYIESEDVAPLAFAKELGSLFSMVGTDIKFLLRPCGGAAVIKLRGSQTIRYTERGMLIEVPDMIAGQQIHLLLDLQIQTPGRAGRHALAETELRYTLPGTRPQEISLVQTIYYDVGDDVSVQIHPDVADRVLLQELAEAWEEAHTYASMRQFDHAKQLITPFLARLKKAPGYNVEGSEIRNWYEQIVDEISIFTQRPDEERYQQIRKAAKSEMADPTGVLRRGNTSIINLNTTQRELLSRLMQKVFGVPHAHLKVEKTMEGSKIPVGTNFPILGETSIGRLGQVQLDHDAVSKRHVRLVATPAGYLVIDLMSTNTPKVNDKPVKEPTLLKENDRIQIGGFVLSFHMGIAPNLGPGMFPVE